jgi:hypothetical protein
MMAHLKHRLQHRLWEHFCTHCDASYFGTSTDKTCPHCHRGEVDSWPCHGALDAPPEYDAMKHIRLVVWILIGIVSAAIVIAISGGVSG